MGNYCEFFQGKSTQLQQDLIVVCCQSGVLIARNSRLDGEVRCFHYSDVIMGAMASQITSLTIIYSTILFRCRWKKTSELRITGLCVGNSPVTGEFPTQRTSNVENVSIWWRHHVLFVHDTCWVFPYTWWTLLISFHEVVNSWMVHPWYPIYGIIHVRK